MHSKKLLAFGYCRFKGYMRSLQVLRPHYIALEPGPGYTWWICFAGCILEIGVSSNHAIKIIAENTI